MLRMGAIIAFSLALSACATQYDTATDQTRPALRRLNQIAERVMRAAGEFCDPGTKTAAGPGDAPVAAASARGGGPGEPVSSGLVADEPTGRGRPRAGRPSAPDLPPERGIMPTAIAPAAEDEAGAARSRCRYPIEVSDREMIYASTNGQRIKITEGMLAFASNDSELAFVLSHELAHDLLGHPSAIYGNGRERHRMELEADYVGIYITARAGYDVDVAAHFILRLASAFPSISEDSSYPAPTARYALLQQALREIAIKIATSAPLVPDFTTKLPRSL